MRDRIFGSVPDEWKRAYEAGLFTEFMEQRAPGHTALDGKIYGKGMLDFKREIAARLAALDYLTDPLAADRREELKAMAIACDAAIHFAERHAELAETHGGRGDRPRRRAELARIAAVCRRVPAHAPRDLWEALQMYWFVHLADHHRAERLGRHDPGPPRPAPAAVLRAGHRRGHPHPRPGQGADRLLLGQVQQPPGPAQGGRHRQGERHLQRLHQHQPRAA